MWTILTSSIVYPLPSTPLPKHTHKLLVAIFNFQNIFYHFVTKAGPFWHKHLKSHQCKNISPICNFMCSKVYESPYIIYAMFIYNRKRYNQVDNYNEKNVYKLCYTTFKHNSTCSIELSWVQSKTTVRFKKKINNMS